MLSHNKVTSPLEFDLLLLLVSVICFLFLVCVGYSGEGGKGGVLVDQGWAL